MSILPAAPVLPGIYSPSLPPVTTRPRNLLARLTNCLSLQRRVSRPTIQMLTPIPSLRRLASANPVLPAPHRTVDPTPVLHQVPSFRSFSSLVSRNNSYSDSGDRSYSSYSSSTRSDDDLDNELDPIAYARKRAVTRPVVTPAPVEVILTHYHPAQLKIRRAL